MQPLHDQPIDGRSPLVGAIGFNNVGGIAAHPSTGVLYGVSNSPTVRLLTINISTEAGTIVGALGSGMPTDIAFNSAGTLDGNYTGVLQTINLTTGLATAVGASNGGHWRRVSIQCGQRPLPGGPIPTSSTASS